VKNILEYAFKETRYRSKNIDQVILMCDGVDKKHDEEHATAYFTYQG
jgi:hypothetical protein